MKNLSVRSRRKITILGKLAEFDYYSRLKISDTERVVAIDNTANIVKELLKYCASYRDPVLWFVKSYTILRFNHEIFCLSVSKGHSRATVYFYLLFTPITLVNDIKILLILNILYQGNTCLLSMILYMWCIQSLITWWILP